MLSDRPRPLGLSEGEKSIVLAHGGTALFGAAVSFWVVNQLGGQTTVIHDLTLYTLWVVLAGAASAALGLYLARRWFGQPGLKGAGQAALEIGRAHV